MPCQCDPPSWWEIQSERVSELLRESRGEPFNHKNPHHSWRTSEWNLDKATAALCAWCKVNDVSRCSLEMQIWWRDHQEADRQREKKEAEDQRDRAIRQAAIAKLTVEERRALGV